MRNGYYCKNIENIIYIFQKFDSLSNYFTNKYLTFTTHFKTPIIFFGNGDYWTWYNVIYKNKNGKYVDNYGKFYNFIDVEQLIREEKLKRILCTQDPI